MKRRLTEEEYKTKKNNIKTLTTAAVYCGNTKGVSDNNAMVVQTCVLTLDVSTLRLCFIMQYAKSLSFFFSIVLFFVVAPLIKKGAANETQ